MPNSSWKDNERSWKSIGAIRTPFKGEDCSHPIFSIECKQRGAKGYPKSIRKWFSQALRNAKNGKIPLLSLHLTGERRKKDLVVLRRGDFEDLFGRLQERSYFNEVNASPLADKVLSLGIRGFDPRGEEGL